MPRPARENSQEVQCPSCFQLFRVSGPAPDECPTEWDYDCEICCRPMLIAFTCEEDDGEGERLVFAEARGINE